LNIDINLLKKILNCPSGVVLLALKSLVYSEETNEKIKVSALIESVSLNRKICMSLIDDLKKSGLFKDLPIIDDLHITPTTTLDTTIEMDTDKKSDKKKKAEIINSSILYPYYEELDKRGLKVIVTPEFRRQSYVTTLQVKKQYGSKLTPKDILNILLLALDNEYLKSIGKTTSLKIIFFSGANLVEKYLRDNPKEQHYPVLDNFKAKMDMEKYGYFVKRGEEYKFIPPEDKEALYYKIRDEIKNRVNATYSSSMDLYFNGLMLKEEYKWLAGFTGKDNKFVGI